MKKIPTLFKRLYDGHKIVAVLPDVAPGMEWVLEGKGTATLKIDGSCCAIINGQLYKRYDAKSGKPVPKGAIKCRDAPDPITGSFPCWVKADKGNPADKWFVEAFENFLEDHKVDVSTHDAPNEYTYRGVDDGTYEAIGKHFQGNPYNLGCDTLVRHGETELLVERSFEGIKNFLKNHYIEGIVFWLDGEPKCKIKRSDFGFEWGYRK